MGKKLTHRAPSRYKSHLGSRWYANDESYSGLLHEDIKLRDHLGGVISGWYQPL